MSGGIAFPNGQYWSAAGWAYRTILQQICAELANRDKYGLHEELSNEYGSAICFEHIDITEWPNSKIKYFFKMINQSYSRCRLKGGGDWDDPEFFAGFIEQYQALVAFTEKERMD